MVNKQTVTSNLFWRFLERIGAQGVSFIVSLILARILEPSVYGSVALISIFISLLSLFIDSGFESALIQKKNADDLDFSSVFYFNIIVGCLLYIIMFLLAPLIANFYKMPNLINVIRVTSIVLIISGFSSIQRAYISKNLMFKKFFFATLTGTIFASIVGIVLALNGFGIWALVIQNLVNNFIDTIILWLTVKWRPKLIFSFSRLFSLLKFSWKLLFSSILDALYNNLRQLIIGKLYTSEDLAFYNKGNSFPQLIINNINSSIDSVLLPSMSQEQNNLERLKTMTRRSIKISTYVIMPMMLGMAVCSEPLIRLLLTDKWLFAVPYLRVFCLAYAFYPIHTANLNAIKALGRSGIFLKLEIIKKTIGMIVLLLTMRFGAIYMAYSFLFVSFISQIINSFPNIKILNYSIKEQISDILPNFLLSLFMAIIVYLECFLPIPDLLCIILQIITGILIYILFSLLFKFESFNYIIQIIKEKFSNKNKK